jgi:uncharacterized protein YndB with AHSA1/START domain
VSNVEPIRKHITVEAPQERAFRVFTQNMTAWWPKEHHIGSSPLASVALEERVGGRWYEIGQDGSQCDWGKVLAWDPPRKVILAWQLSAEWKYDPALVTEVEVSFTVEGPKRTRVELEHRNLERFGDAALIVREQLAKGWEATLPLYAAVCP